MRAIRTNLRARLSALFAFATLALPGIAGAQPAPAATEPVAAEPAKAEPAPEAKAAPAAPTEATPAAKEEAKPDVGASAPTSDDYGYTEDAVPMGGRLDWAGRREIKVIQKRAVLKEARHAFTLQAGVVPNDDFFVYPLIGGGYQYFFSEDLALDIHGAYALENRTSLQDSLQKPLASGGPGLEVRLPQTLNAYATAGVDWYLLHGKFGFFTTKLTEFDLSINFGIGGVQTKVTDIAGKDATRFDPAGEIGAELMFYLASNLGLRAGFRQNFYPAEGGGVSYPISTTLSLTYFTAAPQ